MPRPRKPYHLLSKSGKRRRDIEEEVNAKREMRKIYMKEYRAKNNNARMVMVSEQQEQMSSSISSRHSSIKDVASITSNTCIDHMLSTPTRDDGTSLNRFGSGEKENALLLCLFSRNFHSTNVRLRNIHSFSTNTYRSASRATSRIALSQKYH
jgi:hypothetical protein